MIDVDRTPFGRIAVDAAALAGVVRGAAERVEGVHAVQARRAIKIEVSEHRAVTVSIGVVARAGTVLPDLGRRVQERVAEDVQAALEPSSLRVDVTIEEVAG